MRAGLESCRWCGTRDHPSNPLTLDHIVPISRGGRSTLDNLTILCSQCNTFKGDRTWALESLAEEEALAPPERRWSLRLSGAMSAADLLSEMLGTDTSADGQVESALD
jgi:hypothetical protein